jgi:hypothetical protein
MERSLLALAVLALTACGGEQSAAPPPATTGSAQRPVLKPVSQTPLTVEGSGFHPGEDVQVETDTPHKVKRTSANSGGSFTVAFPDLSGCLSATVTATGSQGSNASFNLSQITCAEP